MSGASAHGLSPPVTRVLVVDDAVVVRQIVARALGAEAGLEVVGLAANGRVAMAMMGRVVPDIVILDLEMPEMNGFETIRAIRRIHPALPIIVYSHLSAHGASATLEALAMGATDFALKPTADGVGMAVEQVRRDLVPQIMALARLSNQPVAHSTMPSTDRVRHVSAVAVAASTGGPNALAILLSMLPADFRAPILIVQHMPPLFTATLALRLNGLCPLPVVEATHGEPVRAGEVYIAPGGHHMEVTQRSGEISVALHDGPKENSCRPAADVLFRSAAKVYGADALAVVLTGMGHDGLEGAKVVREVGGSVIAESETTATVISMPLALSIAGLPHEIFPIDRMAHEFARRVSIGRSQ